MKRFLLAVLMAGVVLVAGMLIFGEPEPWGLGWYALLLVAMFVGSLFDREHFYGVEPKPKR